MSGIVEGEIILVDGIERMVQYGPWRFENGKSSKSGFGLFISFGVTTYRTADNELVWKNRCGVDALEHFGYTVERIEHSDLK